jgi:putative spermidine/putrescine transport system substrate-binding protein
MEARKKRSKHMRQALLRAGAGLCLLFAGAPAMSAGMDDLVAAAKKEGVLTVIALPRDWCGYGALIDSFKAKYGIAVNELNPDGGSGDKSRRSRPTRTTRAPRRPT